MRQLAIVGAAWLAALSCAWPVLAEGFHVIPDVEPGIAVKLYDISGDGSVAVGRSMIAGGFALRWTQSDGNQILGDLIDPPSLSEALAVSKNGEFVVGVGTAFTGVSADYEGFIWTEVSGMESIGTLAAPSPGSFHLLQSLGVSDAGDVVVGYQDHPFLAVIVFGANMGLAAIPGPNAGKYGLKNPREIRC